MNKRFWSILAATALVMSGFQILPALAATEIPEVVQIDDPAGDANFVNDQDAWVGPLDGSPLEHPAGNQTTGDDAGSVSDLMKIWFTNDAETISIHIQTEAPPPASSTIYYRVYANEGEGPEGADTARGCLRFYAVFGGTPASTWVGEDYARVDDLCNVPDPVDAEFLVEEGPDGTGIITITAPRSYSPLFADGSKIIAPYGTSKVIAGTSEQNVGGVLIAQPDNTARGTDYEISAGGGGGDPAPPAGTPTPTSSPTGGPSPEPSPTASPDPEPKKKKKKKNCKKAKTKKAKKKCKKAKKKKNPRPRPTPSPTPSASPSPTGGPPQGNPPTGGSSCAPYAPGEAGAGAETVVVDAEATAEKPLEIIVPTEAGTVAEAPDAYVNIQVDAAAADAGLYAGFLFEPYEDYDIYLEYPDGSEAASAAGFNPVPVIPTNPVFNTNGEGSGGHSEIGGEFLDGVRTADCNGYTLRMHSFLAEGGDRTLQLWLGEPTYDPQPPSALFGAPMYIL